MQAPERQRGKGRCAAKAQHQHRRQQPRGPAQAAHAALALFGLTHAGGGTQGQGLGLAGRGAFLQLSSPARRKLRLHLAHRPHLPFGGGAGVGQGGLDQAILCRGAAWPQVQSLLEAGDGAGVMLHRRFAGGGAVGIAMGAIDQRLGIAVLEIQA